MLTKYRLLILIAGKLLIELVLGGQIIFLIKELTFG